MVVSESGLEVSCLLCVLSADRSVWAFLSSSSDWCEGDFWFFLPGCEESVAYLPQSGASLTACVVMILSV